MHHPRDRITHTTAFVTPVVEYWLEREIAQWVHPMKDRPIALIKWPMCILQWTYDVGGQRAELHSHNLGKTLGEIGTCVFICVKFRVYQRLCLLNQRVPKRLSILLPGFNTTINIV